MAAHVDHKFAKGFFLDEERLRKLHSLIRDRLAESPVEGFLMMKVYRGDAFSYETNDLEQVISEDNAGWRQLTRLDLFIKAPALELSLVFSKSDGAELKIEGIDRDQVFLLFSDIREYLQEEVNRSPLKTGAGARVLSILPLLFSGCLIVVAMLLMTFAGFPEPGAVNDALSSEELVVKLDFLIERYRLSGAARLIRWTEAWASHQSFRPKDGAGGPPADSGDFRGVKRSNATHQSTTDRDARLSRRGPGKEAKLSYGGHILVENRHGLIVDTEVGIGTGDGETKAGLAMLERISGSHRVTVPGDKAYDNRTFVEVAREFGVTPHVAQNTSRRRSRIDRRTTRHPGYTATLAKRPRVESAFGWLKQYGLQRRPMFRGVRRIGWAFTFATAAFNILRISNLMAVT